MNRFCRLALKCNETSPNLPVAFRTELAAYAHIEELRFSLGPSQLRRMNQHPVEQLLEVGVAFLRRVVSKYVKQAPPKIT
jgi:hypothetical protein